MWSQVIRYGGGGNKLLQLRKSKFRRGFSLTGKDREKILTYGMDKLRNDAFSIIEGKLQFPTDDTRITPYRGHPVFVAQHATATCCRKCLWKWHRIPRFKVLDEDDMNYIVGIVMKWVRNQMKR